VASDDATPSKADTQPSGGETQAESDKSGGAKRAVNVGDVLGRYELAEEIGEGGMATVYRARDTQLRRDVAVKVLFAHLAKRNEIVRRFHREARAAAVLEHANILRIYDVGGGEASDPPYMVMELIRGPTLLGEIEKRGPMLAELAACVGAVLADALGAAHDKGVIHRDVKPGNVLIAPDGRVLLADFGVAHLEAEDSLVTRTGALLGTPAYMSPEQATGEQTTVRSDLYSLGATLYQVVTGSLPYSGSPAKVIAQITHGSAPTAVRRRAEVGPDLSRAIERMMDIEPTRRPASATEVAAELRAIASAGGFGDAKDELAAYFADPEAACKAHGAVVVGKVVAAARQAIVDRKLPRAMALADRASALAPEDDSVKSLVDEVTRGGRASRRRRALAIGAVVVAIVGATAAGVAALARGGEEEEEPVAVVPKDAAVVVEEKKDAAMVVAIEPVMDAAMVAEVPIDAVVASRTATKDAGAAKVRPDAKVDAAEQVMAVIPMDAAVPITPPPDAAEEFGTLTVFNTPWCDLYVDGKLYGRNKLGKAITVTVGSHVVKCEQGPKPDNPRWIESVEVRRDKDTRLDRSFESVQIVRIETRGDVRIEGNLYSRGSLARLKMPHRFDVVEEGVDKRRIDFTVPCALREVEDHLVCVPLKP
jgi:serine/threonine-protein kinase